MTNIVLIQVRFSFLSIDLGAALLAPSYSRVGGCKRHKLARFCFENPKRHPDIMIHAFSRIGRGYIAFFFPGGPPGGPCGGHATTAEPQFHALNHVLTLAVGPYPHVSQMLAVYFKFRVYLVFYYKN